MAIKEWSTDFPSSQDDPVTDNQPTLVNESAEGAGDGDATRVSQWHTLRDKLDAACKILGDDGRLPAGSVLDILNSNQVDAGFIRLRELVSDPTNVANKGFVYCKDDGSGNTELYYEDEGGNVTKLTPTLDDNAIHDNVAGEINSVSSKGTPVSGDLLLIEDSADSNNKKKITIGSLPAGSGTVDRFHILGDDTQYTESGSSPVTKISFRDINDSDKAAATYRAVVTLWCANAGATATLTLNIGGSSNTVTSTVNPSETDGAIKSVEVSSPGTDQRLSCTVQLHRSAGTGDVYFKYIDIYKLFT